MKEGGGEYFLDRLFRPGELELFGPADVFLAMAVASLLVFVLSSVYRYTHRGTSYSQSFIITMFLMAVSTSVVMMIIGSNIARAFSLVGALSIIRFRTAMKDARDTGYLFAAMIAGMGCGTDFYMASIMLTAFVSVLMVVLHVSNYGLKQKLESVIRVTYRRGGETVGNMEAELARAFSEFRLINRVLDFGDEEETNVYVVRPRRGGDTSEIESQLRSVDGVVRLSLYQSDQHAPF
jgi:uncharacterized membrane protein YhiD involved in acid resistance